MKYLKEYYNKKDYIELPKAQFDDIIYGDEDGNYSICIKFDNNDEFEIVKDLFTKYKIIFDDDVISVHITRGSIVIYKDNDEYYYIEFELHTVAFSGRFYYRCDQMHGLIECLDMLKNKYNL
jgi:hypothetical protein